MSRSALTQNYTKNEGTLWQDFESIDDWTDWGVGSIENDTVNFKTGLQSIKMNVTEVGSYVAFERNINAIDLRDASRQISIWLYIHDVDAIDAFYIYFYSGSGIYWQTSMYSSEFQYPGWLHVVFTRNDWVDHGGDLGAINRILFKLQGKSGQTPSISLDSLYYGLDQSDGRVLVTFDDNWDTTYTEAFFYMSARGMKGTIFVVPALVGGVGRMTEEQLAEMYDAGWALGNHTYNHTDLTTLTQTEIESELTQCQSWLDTRGFTRASRHVAYPMGTYNDTVLAAMAATEMLTGRRTGGAPQNVPVENLYVLRPYGMPSGASNAKNMVDLAVDYGKTIYFYGHKISAGEWEVADFRALVDYWVQRRAKVVTIDEFYEGLTNPRYTSTPPSRPGA